MSADPPSLEAVRVHITDFLRERVLAPDVLVPPEARLDGLGVDSFRLMELILFTEEGFQVSIPLSLLTPENVATIESLSRCVHGVVAPRAG